MVKNPETHSNLFNPGSGTSPCPASNCSTRHVCYCIAPGMWPSLATKAPSSPGPAAEGQRRPTKISYCCDSRVNVMSLSGAEAGEFFIYRSIANLVPPCKTVGDLHGTSAAVEYRRRGTHTQTRISHVRPLHSNLMTFPFVATTVENCRLAIHGLWTDIAEGGLHMLNPNSNDFVLV